MTATVECPRGLHLARKTTCWVCGFITLRGPCPPELAAAFRVGNIDAVIALVDAHREDYPEQAKRCLYAPWHSKVDAP